MCLYLEYIFIVNFLGKETSQDSESALIAKCAHAHKDSVHHMTDINYPFQSF